ncbi:MAG: hypothetical protein ABSB40_00830 [Nitrososphaeria archaeon]|jgi:hypothetical protein
MPKPAVSCRGNDNEFIIEGDIVFIQHKTTDVRKLVKKLRDLGLDFKEKVVYCG